MKELIISCAIFLIVLISDDALAQSYSDKDRNSIELARFTNESGWTTTVYYLDIADWMPLPGTSSNCGYIIYQGGWGWEIMHGVAQIESTMKVFFWDIDLDGVDEIVTKFGDDSNIWGEIGRIYIDSNSVPQLQILDFPNIVRSWDEEPMDFNPLEGSKDGKVVWKMGPNPVDSVYLIVKSSKLDELELKLIQTSSK